MATLTFDKDKIFKAPDDIVSRTNQDGSVVLMKMDDSEVFYKIDGVAAEMWNKIGEDKPLGKILDELLEEYDVSEDQLYQDTEKYLTELTKLEMIK